MINHNEEVTFRRSDLAAGTLLAGRYRNPALLTTLVPLLSTTTLDSRSIECLQQGHTLPYAFNEIHCTAEIPIPQGEEQSNSLERPDI